MKKWIFGLIGVVIVIIIALPFFPYPLFFFIGLSENPERDVKLTQEAIEKGDYKICKKVAMGYMMSAAQPRRHCYEDVIKKMGDKEICTSGAIEGILSVDECYKIVASGSHDIDTCALIAPSSRESADCYSEAARNKNDSALCANITGSDLQFDKGNCYGYFVTKDDFSMCESIDDTFVKETCYRNYLEKGNVKAEFCTNFTATQKYKNECFHIAARKTKNPSLCDNIQGEYSDYDKKSCVDEATNEYVY